MVKHPEESFHNTTQVGGRSGGYVGVRGFRKQPTIPEYGKLSPSIDPNVPIVKLIRTAETQWNMTNLYSNRMPVITADPDACPINQIDIDLISRAMVRSHATGFKATDKGVHGIQGFAPTNRHDQSYNAIDSRDSANDINYTSARFNAGYQKSPANLGYDLSGGLRSRQMNTDFLVTKFHRRLGGHTGGYSSGLQGIKAKLGEWPGTN